MGFLNKIRSIWIRLTRGILNLIKWFPIIWNDRDFDGLYFYYLMQFKLKCIDETFSDRTKVYQIDESRLNIVKYVRIARILLDRLIKDDFNTEEENAILSSIKHEWIPCEDNPELIEMRTINAPPIEVLRDIWTNEARRKAKTRRLFFLVLEKRIERWWD